MRHIQPGKSLDIYLYIVGLSSPTSLYGRRLHDIYMTYTALTEIWCDSEFRYVDGFF